MLSNPVMFDSRFLTRSTSTRTTDVNPIHYVATQPTSSQGDGRFVRPSTFRLPSFSHQSLQIRPSVAVLTFTGSALLLEGRTTPPVAIHNPWVRIDKRTLFDPDFKPRREVFLVSPGQMLQYGAQT